MAATMGRMHECMKQVGLLILCAGTGTGVMIVVAGCLHMRCQSVVARFVHVADGREHRIYQYGQHQHRQRGKAQHFDKTAAEESGHECSMLAEGCSVKQSQDAYSGCIPHPDALLGTSNERKRPSPMTKSPDQPAQVHWQTVYLSKPVDSVSWYRPHLDVSLALLEKAGMTPSSRVLDVGGGASTLVDDLLDRGVSDITVLDLSEQALTVSRDRLGPRAASVRWIAADLLGEVLPEGGFDLWHDRAVLHFLVDPNDTNRYAEQAQHALRPGGHAVIGGFAPDGPERCSGLVVARRSEAEIIALFGDGFTLIDQHHERHRTPGGTEQSFLWSVLRRR